MVCKINIFFTLIVHLDQIMCKGVLQHLAWSTVMKAVLLKVPFYCLVISLLLMRTSFPLVPFLFLSWIPLVVVTAGSGGGMSGSRQLSRSSPRPALQEQGHPSTGMCQPCTQPARGVSALALLRVGTVRETLPGISHSKILCRLEDVC